MSSINAGAQQLIHSDFSVQERFGISVHGAAEGKCRLSAMIDEGWLNGAGFLHGSVAFALMDSACAYACASCDVRGVTTNGNITYVKGAKVGAELFASAEVVSQSRRVMSLKAEVMDYQGQMLAHGTFLFQLLER